MLNSHSESISLSEQNDQIVVENPWGKDYSWTVADSEQLYNVEGWGDPYFIDDCLGLFGISPRRATSIDVQWLQRSRFMYKQLYETISSI